jgi:hypothetical protein
LHSLLYLTILLYYLIIVHSVWRTDKCVYYGWTDRWIN